MAFFLANKVKETTLTTGTGTVILAGAETDYIGFYDGIGVNNACYYCIVLDGRDQWEVGIGTVRRVGAVDSLERTTVLASSNVTAKINFSAGAKDVYVTLPAGRMLYQNDDGTVRIPNDPTNYTEFLADGQIVFHGTARVLADLPIPFAGIIRDGPLPHLGAEDLFPTIDFDKNNEESIYFSAHTPHDYAPGTDAVLHADFFVDSVDAGVQRAVRFGVEYRVVQHGQVFDFDAGTTTIWSTHEIPVTTADKEVLACNMLTLAAGDLPGEGLLLVRFFRDAGHLDDDHDGDARVMDMHFSYVADRMGVGT